MNKISTHFCVHSFQPISTLSVYIFFFFCFVKLIRHAYESESLFQFKINILYKNKTKNKILIKYKSLYQNEQKE